MRRERRDRGTCLDGTGDTQRFRLVSTLGAALSGSLRKLGREFVFEDLSTCAPRTPQEVAEVANWCARNGDFRSRRLETLHALHLVTTDELGSFLKEPNQTGRRAH